MSWVLHHDTCDTRQPSILVGPCNCVGKELLEALRDEPLVRDNEYAYQMTCGYCQSSSEGDGPDENVEHYAECQWLRLTDV